MRSHALKIASKDFPDFYEGNLPTTCVCFPPPPRLAEAAEAAATRRTLECKCKDVQKVFMPLLKTGPLMIMDFEVSSFNCQICVTFLNYTVIDKNNWRERKASCHSNYVSICVFKVISVTFLFL